MATEYCRNWTVDEDEKLKRLRSTGMHREDIAEELPGYSLAEVKFRWWRHSQSRYQGWTKSRADRHWTEEEISRAWRYRTEDRMQYDEIARRLNRTSQSVGPALRRQKKGQNRPNVDRTYWSPEQDKELLELSESGTPLQDISRQVGPPAEVVQARLVGLRDLLKKYFSPRPEYRELISELAGHCDRELAWKAIALKYLGKSARALGSLFNAWLRKEWIGRSSAESAKLEST